MSKQSIFSLKNRLFIEFNMRLRFKDKDYSSRLKFVIVLFSLSVLDIKSESLRQVKTSKII